MKSPVSNKETIGEYLATLKQGDTIYRKAGGTNLDRVRIARTTPTQIILITGGRYNRVTGVSIGRSTWDKSVIVLPTPEIKQEWKALCLANWAAKTLPDLFKTLTPAQQLELYRHVQALAAVNMSAEAQPLLADDL